MSSPSSSGGASYLLVPAGGQGLRLGGGVPKQFRLWGDRPLLKATLEAFFAPGMPPLAGIALSVPLDRLEEVHSWRFSVPLWAVPGGPTRQASVRAALGALPLEPDLPVMIHDGVRPFPPAGPIREALASLGSWDGVLLGEPSTDTLKRIDGEGRVVATEPRAHIYRAQTPQLALLSTWRRAFQWAQEQGLEGTDDASLLEALGLNVKLVEAPPSNAKLTTSEDWERLAPR